MKEQSDGAIKTDCSFEDTALVRAAQVWVVETTIMKYLAIPFIDITENFPDLVIGLKSWIYQQVL